MPMNKAFEPWCRAAPSNPYGLAFRSVCYATATTTSTGTPYALPSYTCDNQLQTPYSRIKLAIFCTKGGERI